MINYIALSKFRRLTSRSKTVKQKCCIPFWESATAEVIFATLYRITG